MLAQRGDRREHEARRAVRKFGKQRHPRAAFRRALDRADRFVARTQQRDGARLSLAEVVEQVGESRVRRRRASARRRAAFRRARDAARRAARAAPQRSFRAARSARLAPGQRAQRANSLDGRAPRARFGELREKIVGVRDRARGIGRAQPSASRFSMGRSIITGGPTAAARPGRPAPRPAAAPARSTASGA